ncbi:uncharacterized protein LOC120351358 [Nilaparvata lugens]|uniref:uncharacterized protein LOC120351358 n=1 Tax=Nilaparvata lugens TaxID=108931 RepID=UPI00193D03D6|nr:uncharacterized protein LOC120351358 [Nilaparvata lugens]
MVAKKSCLRRRRVRRKIGTGILSKLSGFASTALNKIVDTLPLELHIPSYRFCGPGTKLDKRLRRGDKGINSLDEACKAHDIAYAQHSDNSSRNVADRRLADKAWSVFKNPNTGLTEKAAAYLVTNLIKAKAAFGGGRVQRRIRKRRRRNNRREGWKNNSSLQEQRSAHLRQKAIKHLSKHIAGQGFYLRPYAPLYKGGRIIESPSPSQRRRRNTTKKRRRRRRAPKKVRK